MANTSGIELALTVGLCAALAASCQRDEPAHVKTKQPLGPGIESASGEYHGYRAPDAPPRPTGTTLPQDSSANLPGPMPAPEPTGFSIAAIRKKAAISGQFYGLHCLLPASGMPRGGEPVVVLSFGSVEQTWTITIPPAAGELQVKALGHPPVSTALGEHVCDPREILHAIWHEDSKAKVLGLELAMRTAVTSDVDAVTGDLKQTPLVVPVELYEAWLSLDGGQMVFRYFTPDGEPFDLK